MDASNLIARLRGPSPSILAMRDAAEEIERLRSALAQSIQRVREMLDDIVEPTQTAQAAVTARPCQKAAERAVEDFMREKLGEIPAFQLVEDGDENWSFWVTEDGCEEDTTSYVHADLSIEWYGTAWEAPTAEPVAQGEAVGGVLDSVPTVGWVGVLVKDETEEDWDVRIVLGEEFSARSFRCEDGFHWDVKALIGRDKAKEFFTEHFAKESKAMIAAAPQPGES